jgi:hypothetical protein
VNVLDVVVSSFGSTWYICTDRLTPSTGRTCRGGYRKSLFASFGDSQKLGGLLSHLEVVARTLQYFLPGLTVG